MFSLKKITFKYKSVLVITRSEKINGFYYMP